MNCLYSSSASQKARGKGLWPVPGLCTRDSVSCLSPKVNINPAQEVSLTGTHTQATLHIVFYLPLSVNNHNKKLSATQDRRPPGRDLNAVCLGSGNAAASWLIMVSGKAASSTWKPRPLFISYKFRRCSSPLSFRKFQLLLTYPDSHWVSTLGWALSQLGSAPIAPQPSESDLKARAAGNVV